MHFSDKSQDITIWNVMNKDKENNKKTKHKKKTPKTPKPQKPQHSKETQENIKEVSWRKSSFCTQKLQIPEANYSSKYVY